MKNKFTFLFIFFVLVYLFVQCSSDVEFNENALNRVENSNQLTLTVDKTTIDSLTLSPLSKAWLLELYTINKNRPIWLKNDGFSKESKAFIHYLNSDIALNLPYEYLKNSPFTLNASPIVKEIKSALRCAEFLSLKDTALINYKTNTLNHSALVSPEKFLEFVEQKNNSNNLTWVEHLISYKAKNKRLIQMHFALNRFTDEYGIEQHENDAIYLKIPQDSLANNLITQQLIKRNFINNPLKDTLALQKSLRSFQILNGLNPDAKLGKHTLEALTANNYSRYLKGVIALDKMRTIPDSLQDVKHIEINIPSFLLHFYVDGESINTAKVIIGTTYHPTPTLSANMKYIVINPYWYVPYSIASREILPHLKKDSLYLQKNNYTLLDRSDKKVIPDSIDWNNYQAHNFPFFIRQDAGSFNSLGRVKFMFPNHKSIYVHDTPSKHLFAKDQRTYSHGCIRTENPFLLVDAILTHENHPYVDSIEVFKKKNKETYLLLSDTFPVNIVYRTAGFIDSTKQIQFYNDVYKKETALYDLFDTKNRNLE